MHIMNLCVMNGCEKHCDGPYSSLYLWWMENLLFYLRNTSKELDFFLSWINKLSPYCWAVTYFHVLVFGSCFVKKFFKPNWKYAKQSSCVYEDVSDRRTGILSVFFFFFPLLGSQSLEQCLAHWRQWVLIDWMNEWDSRQECIPYLCRTVLSSAVRSLSLLFFYQMNECKRKSECSSRNECPLKNLENCTTLQK